MRSAAPPPPPHHPIDSTHTRRTEDLLPRCPRHPSRRSRARSGGDTFGRTAEEGTWHRAAVREARASSTTFCLRSWMAECKVRVLNVPRLHNVDLLDKLTIHFLRKSNGGGELTDVSYCTDTPTEAIVTFEDPAVAKRVLQIKHHVLNIKGDSHSLQVVPLEEQDSGEVLEKVIMVINLFRIPTQQQDGFLESLKRFPVTVSLNQSQRQCTVEGPFSLMEEIHTHINTFVSTVEFRNENKNVSHKNDESSEIKNEAQTEIDAEVKTKSGSENVSKDLVDFGEIGKNKEDTIEMLVESDVFIFLTTFCKMTYDNILAKHNVEVIINDIGLGDLTVLNVKSKVGLPCTIQQIKNASEELAELFADLQSRLRKDTVRINSAFAKDFEKVSGLLRVIKERFQTVHIAFREDECEVDFIGTPSDIFYASLLLCEVVKNSGTDLPNREPEQGSNNNTDHPPAESIRPSYLTEGSVNTIVVTREETTNVDAKSDWSTFSESSREEHECLIQVDSDVWRYISHLYSSAISFVCEKYKASIKTRDVKNNKTMVTLMSGNRGILSAKEELTAIMSQCKHLHKEIFRYDNCNISPMSDETKLMLKSLEDKHQRVSISEDVNGITLLGREVDCLSVIQELKALSGKKQEKMLKGNEVQSVESNLQDPVTYCQGWSITVDDGQDNSTPGIADAQPLPGPSELDTCSEYSEVGLKDAKSAKDVQLSLQDDQDLKSATDESKIKPHPKTDSAQSSLGSPELHIDANPQVNVEYNVQVPAVNVQDVNVINEENKTASPNVSGRGQSQDLSEIHKHKESGHPEDSSTRDTPSEAENPEPSEDSYPISEHVRMETIIWKYIQKFLLNRIEESVNKRNVNIKVVKEVPIIELTISGTAHENVRAVTNILNETVQECKKMHRENISGNVLDLTQDEKTLRYFVDAVNMTGLKVVLHKLPESIVVFGEKGQCLDTAEKIKTISEKFTSSNGEATGNDSKDLKGKTQLEECCSEATPNLSADTTDREPPPVPDQQQ
uniref:Uncharacterized protein LOC116938606 isoform X3 n=1 Tax=Petromyzon marinus TaxID=7757 RepID=A0AAJ7SM50_PETMA|nr:uncharacterized protein LOC116938606 isoform X3 [Petromyzon marinus]